ncbi:MAG: thiamine phosphate synthase [Smithella sp.]
MRKKNIPTIRDGSLYLVLSEEYGGGTPVTYIAQQAVMGDIDILQMREKNKSREELLSLGYTLSLLCKKNSIIFIVNDDPLLAGTLDADGVHLGQEDIIKYPLNSVRKIIGDSRIIGLSTHSLEQFRKANQMDIDYIAFGPVFPTKTKNYHIGTGDVPKVLQEATKPVIFIGGINTTNLDVLLAEGVSNIALIRDIMQAENILAQTKWYKNRLINRAGGYVKARINGKEELISENSPTLQELIINRGLLPQKVVVEVNLKIIPREQWPNIQLQNNDHVEIISFVGGG